MTETVRIWVVTDARAGNLAQALGLAEAIGRHHPVEIEQRPVRLKPWAAQIPPALSSRMGMTAKGWPFSGIADRGANLTPPWPDLVIGAGRRVAVIVAALRKIVGMKAVQLLDPQMRARAFDAVVVPSHDRLTGENVLVTTGALNGLTREEIAGDAAFLTQFEDLPKPRCAVLIGGPSRSNRFGAEDEAAIVAALTALEPDHGLMITPSRRTPETLLRSLPNIGPNAWVWDGSHVNPYPGMLHYADAVLVTADSVNMTSEAAATGLPVHVLPVTGLAAKIERFQAAMAERGITRPFTGTLQQWSYDPLAEADRIAAELIKRGIVAPRMQG